MKPGVKYEVVDVSSDGVVGYIQDGDFYESGHKVGTVDSDGLFSLHINSDVRPEFKTGKVDGDQLIRGDGTVFFLREC